MRPTMMPRRVTVTKPAATGSGAPPKPSTSNGQAPITKFSACYRAIFAGTVKPEPYDEQDPERFYFDLFCLNVDKTELSSIVESVPDTALIESGSVKNNIRELFFFSVKCIKTSEADDLRLGNVFLTLQVVLRYLLSRKLPNYSYDTMNLLAGSLEQSDVVFTDFVAGLDGVLCNPSCTTAIKERALALALLVVTSINQGAINSYFLRRDLFSSVTKLIVDPPTAHLAADGSLLLGILANYHKFEARNAMLVRFEDLVDETIMRRVREAVSAALLQARDAYVDKMDDLPVSFAANVMSLVSSFRSLSGPLSPTKLSNGGTDPMKEESAYADLPLEISAMLLPVYDLLNSNKAFCSFLMHDKSDSSPAEADFVSTFVSFLSYLGTHAAVSARSQLYSRLAFIMLAIMVEEGAQITIPAEYAAAVRICRQRQPALPYNEQKRPIMCAILDTIVQYLRFNIVRKRFDVGTYLICLKLIHKIMHQLKTIRTRLAYDWQPMHQAILSLAQFLVARQVELSDLPGMEDLITQVLLTLDFAVIWADVILPDMEAIAQLYYEILRSDNTITKLGTLISLHNAPLPPPSPRLGPGSPSVRRNSSSGISTPKSPSLPTTPSFGFPEPSGPAAESVRNLGVVRSHFGGKLEDYKEKTGSSTVEAHELLAIIKSCMDGMDLRESMALEEVGMRRYIESEQEEFFGKLVSMLAQDIRKLGQTSAQSP